jgi:hypothetical protein
MIEKLMDKQDEKDEQVHEMVAKEPIKTNLILEGVNQTASEFLGGTVKT